MELTATTAEVDKLDPDPELIAAHAELARPLQSALAIARARPPHQHPAATLAEAGHRFPGAELIRWIHARDRTSRFPMSTVPAVACHLDHTHDVALGGTTVAGNLGPLAVGDHLRKHDPRSGWTVTQPEPGVFDWTSPTGLHHLLTPEPHHPIHPVPRPPHDYGVHDHFGPPRPQSPWRPRTDQHGHLTDAARATITDLEHRRRTREGAPPHPLDMTDPPF